MCVLAQRRSGIAPRWMVHCIRAYNSAAVLCNGSRQKTFNNLSAFYFIINERDKGRKWMDNVFANICDVTVLRYLYIYYIWMVG